MLEEAGILSHTRYWELGVENKLPKWTIPWIFAFSKQSLLCDMNLAIFVLKGTGFNVVNCIYILPAKINNQSGLTEDKGVEAIVRGHQYFWTHLHTLDFWNLAGSALIFSPMSFLPQRKRERCYFYNCSLEHSVYF